MFFAVDLCMTFLLAFPVNRQTKVGVKYQPEQMDFRTLLKSTSVKSK
jgi:hypothetical protein